MKSIITELAFPEGIRWRNGALYFSDIHSHQILRWSDAGLQVLGVIPGGPSGLGFLDDDTILVASQKDRCVFKINLMDNHAQPQLHADLSQLASWHLNDMVSDDLGRVYVGNYGSGAPPGEPIAPAVLILVDVDGSARVVAENLYFPNGMVLRAGGQELVVAETRSEPGRLTVFDVDRDGGLSGRRVLMEFETEWPDGLALDSEGAVWVASPFSGEVLRVSAPGEIVDRLAVENPYAVALGGPDGRDLFVCTAETWVPEQAAVKRKGEVKVLRVDVPA